MKKFLVLILLFSMLFGVVGVMAVGPITDLNANVSEIITATVTPNVDFGLVAPGGIYTLANAITITPDNSTVNIKVEVSNVIGLLFINNLKLDNVSPIGKFWTFTCDGSGGVCVWNPPSSLSTPSLTIPVGFSAGLKTGTIVYLVTKA